jgi:hypothetical protein
MIGVWLRATSFKVYHRQGKKAIAIGRGLSTRCESPQIDSVEDIGKVW